MGLTYTHKANNHKNPQTQQAPTVAAGTTQPPPPHIHTYTHIIAHTNTQTPHVPTVAAVTFSQHTYTHTKETLTTTHKIHRYLRWQLPRHHLLVDMRLPAWARLSHLILLPADTHTGLHRALLHILHVGTSRQINRPGRILRLSAVPEQQCGKTGIHDGL
jgi:hypothetical protein